MQIPILNGIYTDSAPDLRTSYPRNLVPVPKENGISHGYLKPSSGIESWGHGAATGPGRGGIKWNGVLFRVMGTNLVSVASDGTIAVIGSVGGSGQVSMDYGFDRIAIASGGHLFYWTGSAFIQVTDPHLGTVLDVKWFAGYYCTTDGSSIVVTELNNPTVVNPLAYGSSESSPDPIVALDTLRDELYALNRFTIQTFQNVGQSSITQTFPFQAVEGATVPKGPIGTHAYCSIGNTFIFLGSGFGEAPAVYIMIPGDTVKVSTREIDRILLDYTEAQLAQVVCEAIVDRNHQLVLFHLPDQCWAYDTIGSKTLGEPVWYCLDSGSGPTRETYRARNFVWAYDRWCCEDPTSTELGQTTDDVSTHYGQTIAWEIGTQIVYADGNDANVLELELVGMPGRVPLGANPTIWTSHSNDGETWSAERPISAGKQGDRLKRLAWRLLGRIRNYRVQKFRGTSDAHLPLARLEARFEPLTTRPGNG